jgi:hypothetical protein
MMRAAEGMKTVLMPSARLQVKTRAMWHHRQKE